MPHEPRASASPAMMFSQHFVLGSEDTFCAFVAAAQYVTVGGNQVVSLAGAQVGDLALLIGMNESAVTGLTTWTHLTQLTFGGDTLDVWYKVLGPSDVTAGSITVGSTTSQSELGLLIYRGPTAATVKSAATGTTASLTVPGYTKTALARGVVAICGEQPGSGGSMVIPNGATTRIAPFGGTTSSLAAADYIPAIKYVNGQALIWTGLMNTDPNGAEILELT